MSDISICAATLSLQQKWVSVKMKYSILLSKILMFLTSLVEPKMMSYHFLLYLQNSATKFFFQREYIFHIVYNIETSILRSYFSQYISKLKHSQRAVVLNSRSTTWSMLIKVDRQTDSWLEPPVVNASLAYTLSTTK